MNKNAQQEMEQIIMQLAADGAVPPRLLLHSCCAPCSSSVLERLSPHFRITVLYYNPNIAPPEEYCRRAQEQARFVAQAGTLFANSVDVQQAAYHPQEFYSAVASLEEMPEGSARCFACYALRMRRTAEHAKAEGYDWFTTTLSVSPHKNAAKLNELGWALQAELGVSYLPADFKKKNGFQRSTQLAAEYGLYRQDYCGCVFSRRQADERKAKE